MMVVVKLSKKRRKMSSRKSWIISLILLLGVMLIPALGGQKASAWIGTGSGGNVSGGGGGGGSNCGYPANHYAIDCIGTSWIFYQANSETSDWVQFPYLNTWPNNELTVDAWIPPECSQGSGTRGFWHFGINGDDLSMNDSWTMLYVGGWYGHWLTLNWGHPAASWPPYYQSENGIGASQWVGPYYSAKYGTTSIVLEQYRKAWVYENRKNGYNVTLNDAPTSLPSDLWGFCYGDYMNEVTLTIKAIDMNGNSLSGIIPDRSFGVSRGGSGSVRAVNLDDEGYIKVKWGTSTNSSTWTDSADLSYSYSGLDADTTVYAVYQTKEFFGRARVKAGDSVDNTNSTGYIQAAGNKNITISCTNAGCKATWDLALKKSGSIGSTEYRTGISNNGGSTSWTPTNRNSALTWPTSNVSNSDFGLANGKTYEITTAVKNTMAMDVYDGKINVSATNIWLYPENYSNAQKWKFEKNSDGTYTIKNAISGKAIDLYYQELKNGGNIVLHDSNGTCAQKWRIQKNSDHTYTFFSSCSKTNNWAIDLYGGGATLGQNIQIYESNGTMAQKWHIYNVIDHGVTSTDAVTVSSNTSTLLPGQSKCYSLEFKPYGTFATDYWVSAVSSCATAEVSNFSGKASVSGTASGNTGWKSSNTSNTFFASNCSDGCKVTFNHAMERTQGIGSTTYTITRQSNLVTGTRKIKAGTLIEDETFDLGTDKNQNNKEKSVRTSGEYTLYPGMVVCEKLTFKPNNNTVTVADDVYVQACASALGDSQPGDPGDPDDPGNPGNDPNGDDESNAFIDIQVKNTSVRKYNTYRRYVYAKPGDELSYRATYNPILQYTYYLKPQQMRINSGTIYPSSDSKNTSQTLGTMFNANKGTSLQDWNNAFSVRYKRRLSDSATFNGGSLIENYNATYKGEYSPGNTAKKRETNERTVTSSDPGGSMDEQAIINLNTNTQTTPRQVEFTQNGNYNLGNVKTSGDPSVAYARIPYNFNTEISDPVSKPTCLGKEGTVCAGEGSSISFTIKPTPKTNCETTNTCTGGNAETYTTLIPEARKEVVIYDPDAGGGGVKDGVNNWGSSKNDDLCGYFGLPHNETSCGYARISSNDNNISTSGSTFTANFNIQDKIAGSRLCAAAAVYPSNSGADNNWNDKEGSHTWRISKSTCYTISKKPNLEVWGGNIYSKGKIETSVTSKNHLANYSPSFSVATKNSKTYIFGSWGELGLISSGNVKGLASGASTGFAANSGGTLMPNPFGGVDNNSPLASSPGGSEQDSFCVRSPLSFANSPCSNTTGVGSIGNSVSINSATSDKTSISSKFFYGGDPTVSGMAVLNDEEKIKERNIYYYYSGNEDLSVNGQTVDGTSTVRKGTIQVVHSRKNVNIVGNLVYENGYQNFAEMPKLVIYAENDVNISCGVNRIDAILIAENSVKTCSDSNDVNARVNANPLTINGGVVSKTLEPRRTYGAATGANSVIPAEIINFDTSLYLWGGDWNEEAVDNQSTNMDITYNKEIAPRL